MSNPNIAKSTQLRHYNLPAEGCQFASLMVILVCPLWQIIGCFQLVPSCVSSIIDLLTNSFGTVLGALLAFVWQASWSPEGELGKWRERHILPGPLPEIGLMVILAWALSQLAPYVPSVDLGGIKHAIKPLWQTAHDLSLFKIPDATTYCCYIAALGIVAQTSARESSRPLPFFALFAAVVLFAKIFVMGRQISLEALSGLLAAAMLWVLITGLSRGLRLYTGMVLLIAGFTVYDLKAGVNLGVSQSFNWVPFRGQLAYELTGFETILEGIWPFATLSYLLLLRFGTGRGITLLGSAFVLLLVFILEWLQLSIPSRTADVTQTLLALAGWLVPLLYLQHSERIGKVGAGV